MSAYNYQLMNDIRDGLCAAILERKNVILKPEYQTMYLNGVTNHHPAIGHGKVDTSNVIGLRLEDTIESADTGKVTYVYFRTENREYMSCEDNCFYGLMSAIFEECKDSGRSFADFDYLFDEVSDKIPEVQIISKEVT